MAVPIFGLELARERLAKRHLSRATLTSEAYPPAAAVGAGFLDEVTTPERLLDDALAVARRYATTLVPDAFARTKRRLRGAVIAHIRDTLADDMRRFASGE
jgi:enoyl-CoA hydratase